MAIPGMVQNFNVQTANGTNLASWSTSAGATSYDVQRSTDNITYASVATVSAVSYLDTAVTLGLQYWYKVAAINGSGTSPYTTPQSVVPVTSGEMSLGAIRLAAQQRADMVGSQFVTLPEWNTYINQAMFELYDLLVTVYEDYFIATPAQFATNGSSYLFPLPNGVTSWVNGVTGASGYIAPAFYKLVGVDMSVNPNSNSWVTLNKFNFIDRNTYMYTTPGPAIYSIWNPQYRLMGSNIEFIPTPQGNQSFRIWYIPRLTMLLQDTDVTTQGVSGWIEYVIVRAAKYALDKQNADTTKLDQQIIFLTKRIEESSMNRDAGRPDTITNVRKGGWGSGYGNEGGGWPIGGF